MVEPGVIPLTDWYLISLSLDITICKMGYPGFVCSHRGIKKVMHKYTWKILPKDTSTDNLVAGVTVGG